MPAHGGTRCTVDVDAPVVIAHRRVLEAVSITDLVQTMERHVSCVVLAECRDRIHAEREATAGGRNTPAEASADQNKAPVQKWYLSPTIIWRGPTFVLVI
jgi:hypothetical protein